MKTYNAYHITKNWNIESIAKNGLLPNCGESSMSVGDKTGWLFFTTYENVDFWIHRFNLKRSEIVILNFIAENQGQRIHERNDFCTKNAIPAEDIYVVTEYGNIPIKDFYLMNKVYYENLTKENIMKNLDNILLMLRNILSSEDKKYTTDNCIRTLDLLARIIVLNDRSEFQKYLKEIKNSTLQLLKLNGVNEIIENYNLIATLFERILNNNEEISMKEVYELKQRIVYGFDYDPKLVNDFSVLKCN